VVSAKNNRNKKGTHGHTAEYTEEVAGTCVTS